MNSLFKILFILLILFFLPCSFSLNGQNLNKVDSLLFYRNYIKLAEKHSSNAKYDSAIYYYNKSMKYYNQDTLTEKYFSTLLKLCHVYRIKQDYLQAQKCIDFIESHSNFKTYKNDNLYSEFLHQKGSVIGSQGNYNNAINILKKLIEFRKTFVSKEDTIAAKTYNNIGLYFYYLNNYNEALKHYKKNLKLDLLRKGNNTYDLIANFINIGNVYLQIGEFDKALIQFNKCLVLSKKLETKETPRVARVHLSIGSVFTAIGKYDKALYHYKLAQNYYIKTFGQNYTELGTLYMSIARVYGIKANYDEAELYYTDALRILNNNYSPNYPMIGIANSSLGKLYESKNKFNIAIEYYKSGLKMTTDPTSKVITLLNIAQSYQYMKKFEVSEKYFVKAIKTCIDKLGYNHFTLGNTYLSYANFLSITKKSDSSFTFYTKALKIFKVSFSEKSKEIASTYLAIANYFLQKENLSKALNYCQKSLISNDNLFNNTITNNNPNFKNAISESTYINILLKKAEVFSKLYKQNNSDTTNAYQCLNCYQLAMQAFDHLKSTVGSNSKLYLTGNTRNRFDKVFETYYDRFIQSKQAKYLKAAFRFAEKGKAAILLSSMKGEDAIKFSGIPDTLQLVEKEIKEKLNGYRNLVYDENNKKRPDSTKINLWNQKLFDLSHQYDSLLTHFEKDYPEYYNLKYDHNVVKIDDIKKQLSQDQLLVEYVLTDSILYRFTLGNTEKKSSFVKKKLDTQFYDDLKIVQNTHQIDFSNHTLDDYKKYVYASNRLYTSLFEGLETKKEKKKLIIIPDGSLGYVPFEALVSKLPDFKKVDYRKLPYLLRENPISYSYSSTLLFRNLKKKAFGKKLMAVAPDYVYNLQKQSTSDELFATRKQYDPLKFAQIEVDNISAIFSAEVYKNKDASETQFKKHAPNYNIIHLAMHTEIDNESPMHSKMVFAPPIDSIDDGYLNTIEIYGLNLKAKMAVLSACNTGGGKINKGEGIMSLARGFIYAGVPSIVMTLWNVQDKSGSDIMSLFYEYLDEGMTKDVALQKAKLTYLSQSTQLHAHPYFWAAYVDIGNTEPIKNMFMIRYGKYLYILAFILLILVAKKWYVVWRR
jgi:CHAT domain-containing protein